jgi:ectoine hydroxylase-related dioxygenase (phytanoyl-CoA dioxygenase family)
MHPADLKRFEENGYLTGIRVFGPDQADRIREQFNALEAREGRERCRIGLQGRHLDVPFLWYVASHPTIVDCMEALIGPDVLLLSTHVFCKYPEDAGKFVAWHQDVTYWGLEPPYALTAWYAVDDSDVENGCMRVIPGSHRRGIFDHGTSQRPGNLLSINQEVTEPVDESQAVDLVLRAGEISIHHGHLIHGSNPNRSNRRRCGLTMRYVPPYVKPVRENSLKKPWPAVVVRGEDRERNFGDWTFQFDPKRVDAP